MTERLRIQKQMSHIEEGFPYLAKYLAGWPASTHGTQVLGLAEMKAKEIMTGSAGSTVYAVTPGSGEANAATQADLNKVNNVSGGGSGSGSVQQSTLDRPAATKEGNPVGRRQINLRGLPIDE